MYTCFHVPKINVYGSSSKKACGHVCINIIFLRQLNCFFLYNKTYDCITQQQQQNDDFVVNVVCIAYLEVGHTGSVVQPRSHRIVRPRAHWSAEFIGGTFFTTDTNDYKINMELKSKFNVDCVIDEKVPRAHSHLPWIWVLSTYPRTYLFTKISKNKK